MTRMKLAALTLLPVLVVALGGCGSSSGGSAGSDPFAGPAAANASAQFGNVSTANGKTGLSLAATPSTVDADTGQVLVTAKALNEGAPVSGVPVTFSITAPLNGPATFEPGMTTVTTDVNGVAFSRLTTGSASSTMNVLVSATARIAGRTTIANASFQIVRGGGKIELASEPDPAPVEIPASFPPGAPVEILDLFSFRLTDSNGNPRVGTPVTLSIFSAYPSSTPIFVPYTTLITGSDGKGWFNANVQFAAPGPGGFKAASVVYQARTNDPNTIINYAGRTYRLTQKEQ